VFVCLGGGPCIFLRKHTASAKKKKKKRDKNEEGKRED